MEENATFYLWAEMQKTEVPPQDDNFTLNDLSL